MKISAGKSTGSRSHALFSVLIVFLLLFSSLPIASAEEAIEPTIEPIEVLNSPPVASDDAYTLEKGGTLDIPAPGVLANDVDAEGEAFTVTKLTDPAHGTLTLNADGSFTYVHDGSETLSDSFTYKASDGQSDSNAATVTLTIVTPNTPPVPSDDAYALDEGATLEIPAPGVLANDTDAEGDPLSALVLMDPVHGTLTLNADGSFTYVHDGSETLSDSFTYKASDGKSDLNSAVVTLTVNPVNDPPAAADDTYSMGKYRTLKVSVPGVLGNDADAEGSPLSARVMMTPMQGYLTLNPDGSFVYTRQEIVASFASGTATFAAEDAKGQEPLNDYFTYVANDGKADSNVATVTVIMLTGDIAEGEVEVTGEHAHKRKATAVVSPDRDVEISSSSGKMKLNIPQGALADQAEIEIIEHGQWGPRSGGMLNVFELNAYAVQRDAAKAAPSGLDASSNSLGKPKVDRFMKSLQITVRCETQELRGAGYRLSEVVLP